MAPQPHHHLHRVDGGEGGPVDIKSAYWKAWVTALLTKAGDPGHKGDSKVVFLATSDANRSIPASKYIPMATTNAHLFAEADALLDAHNPVYKGNIGGYCYSLLEYMPQPPFRARIVAKSCVLVLTSPVCLATWANTGLL